MKHLLCQISAKTLYCMLLATTLLFVACSKSSPDYADEPYIKNWIMEKCSRSGAITDRWNDFNNELVLGNIKVEGYEEYSGMDAPTPMNFTHACDVVLARESWRYTHVGRDKGEYINNAMAHLNKVIYGDIPKRANSDYRASLTEIQTNPNKAILLMRNILEAYVDFSYEVADKCVEVLEHGLDKDVKGSSYVGFWVTYRLNNELSTRPYVLVQLTEFDDDRYEITIRDRSKVVSGLDVVYTDK